MKLSISGKIISIAIVGVVASSVIVFFIVTALMDNLLTRTVHDDMAAMQSLVVRMQEQEEARLLQEMYMLTTMQQLMDAVNENDVPRLEEIIQISWHRLDFDAITITNREGVVLARGHAIEKEDDISDRQTIAAALNGEITTGIFYEEGALVPYAIRCYAPIFNKDDEIIGVLSLGSEIGSEAYVDNLQQISGMHFTLFKGSTSFVTSIKDEDGNRAIGAKPMDTQLADRVIRGGEVAIVRAHTLGEPSMIAYWPIKNVDGSITGMWAISRSLAQQEMEERNVMMISVFSSMGIILLIVIFSLLLGRRIALPIRKATAYAVQVSGGNLDHPLDIHPKADKMAANENDEVGVLIDALQKMVQTLKERIREADDANNAKSSFLRTMSHEIRTPMNAILGIVEVQLQNDTLDTDLREALDRVYTSGVLLLGIINDILDLSKIEVGKLELIVDRYEIASLVSDTAQLNIMRIGSKPVEFELHTNEYMPAHLLGDVLRVKQILSNLLSNAFKYTAEGKVTLSVTAEASDRSDDEVILVANVKDTGQGMTKEQISKLFDEYSRFNQETNRTTEGTGLGMSITQNLVCMMNGSISVESEPGKGSEFTVRLPQGRVGTDTLGREIAENLNKFRTHGRLQLKQNLFTRDPMPYGSVLIVDDVDMNIYVTKGYLIPYRLSIDFAGSGFAAIEKIRDGKVYDVIFMDQMMPRMDGIATAKILRGMGYDQPIVALTANAVVGQADVFQENGFDGFISKPIDTSRLNDVLNELIRDKYPAEVVEAARQQSVTSSNAVSAGSAAYSSRQFKTPVIDRDVPGLDISEGLGWYNGDAHTYLMILRSYVAGVRTMLEAIETVKEDELADYEIIVHGIKGSSRQVFAWQIFDDAQLLERAVASGDFDYVRKHNPAFIKTVRKLIGNLEALFADIDAENPKPFKDKPDDEILGKLLGACKAYDMDSVDAIMTEIKKYQYESDGGLVDFLSNSFDMMNLAQIVERLTQQ